MNVTMSSNKEDCYKSLVKAQSDLAHELRNGFAAIQTQTQKIKQYQKKSSGCYRWCRYWAHEIDSQLLRVESALADFSDLLDSVIKEVDE